MEEQPELNTKQSKEEEKYYSLRDVRMLQRKMLMDLGVPEEMIEERREAILKNAVQILKQMAVSFNSLATKIGITDCLNDEDFSKIFGVFATKLPISGPWLKVKHEDIPSVINFLTLTREQEMLMILSKNN